MTINKKKFSGNYLKDWTSRLVSATFVLSEANRYFDTAENKTKTLLQNHEKDLHKTIGQKRFKKFYEEERHKKGKERIIN